MEIFNSLFIVTVLFILYVIYINDKNKKYNNYTKNTDDEIDKVSYRNSHSVYRNDFIYSNKNNYKKYRYNIENYILKKSLLKESEYKFYNILKSNISNDFIICPKIKISNFIEMLDQRSWEDHYDKINYQSIDYLICDNYFKPLFGIILYYGNPNIKTENEKFLEQIFITIKLPILKFELSKNYSNDLIKFEIEYILKSISNPESNKNN